MRRAFRAPLAPLATVLVSMGLWELVARLGLSRAVAPLSEILEAMGSVVSLPAFRAAIGQSATSLGVGYAAAVAVGVTVGFALGLSRTLEGSLGFYVNLMMSAPASAFVPIMIALFGTGQGSTTFIVFFFAVFVIIVNTSTAVRRTPPELVEMGRAFGHARGSIVRTVVLPAALPLTLTGLRLGFGRAVAGLVLGEILISIVGLGALLIDAGNKFQIARLWALVTIIVAFTLAVSVAMEIVETRLTRWRR